MSFLLDCDDGDDAEEQSEEANESNEDNFQVRTRKVSLAERKNQPRKR